MQKIYTLLRRGFERHLSNFSPSALKLTPQYIQSSLSTWRVCILNREIVGCTMAYEEEGFFTFCYMTIDYDYRQIGLGKEFVKAMVNEARKHQLGCIKIVLREALTENVQFFTNQGFIRTLPFKSNIHYIYELELTK
ncbi:GNAT family N-acetyltransferase [Bartonella senegalensis]|uniref:GNAT family N-acetyltransferase n=1 Tax=Bartonella senegalensis TaxID=1468418 RepID=UPI0018A7FB4C|nr:GNAT family N-acetyltransferase [Bartonella senegalensis]